MAYGWEGSRLRLVPLDRERHLDNAVRWLNDPELTRWLLIGDLPITRLAEEEAFTRFMKPNDADIVLAVETHEGEHLGFTGLHKIDWRHGCASTGSFIGEAERRGQGYGTEAIALRCAYAFDVLGLRLLLSDVLAHNAASLRALAKAGYREVGRLPQRYFKRGAWRDLVLLAAQAEGWQGQRRFT